MILIPDIGTTLTIAGPVKRSAAERFTTIFRSVWSAIPVVDRRKMLAYWLAFPGNPAPEVILVSSVAERLKFPLLDTYTPPAGRAEKADSGFTEGACLERGRRLAFDADYFSILSDAASEHIIAHEAGHVFGRACCTASARRCDAEDVADAAAGRWGFPVAASCLMVNSKKFCATYRVIIASRLQEMTLKTLQCNS